MEEFFIEITLFFGIFFSLIATLSHFSKKLSSVPYTILLLIAGFVTQLIFAASGLPTHFSLDSALIYHVLLPILLFESSFHINIHQFKIQFKTISFLATFTLLLSVAITAAVLFFAVDIPLSVALLYGSIIATTDVIGVIALFKTVGGPKRLALVADGESLLSDSTGVLIFKLVSTFVVANEIFNTDHLFSSVHTFLYSFVGSMIVGSIIGYVVARFVFPLFKEDKLLLTTITIAFSLLVFNATEHFLHLSGVVTLVIAAVVLGNFSKGVVKPKTAHFMSEFWEYIGFFCVSLVFFFATFNLDSSIFSTVPIFHTIVAIVAALLGRALSVYISCYITNTVPPFRNEPNIPMSWQHILNWGGVRGVLPLIFVYSLPIEYPYYAEVQVFTLATILFTLIINGFTVKYLVLWLKLHLPKLEESIIAEETAIFFSEEQRKKLATLPLEDFSSDVIKEVEAELIKEEQKHRKIFDSYQKKPELLINSFRIQIIQIQKAIIEELFQKGYINEGAYLDFDIELDLQLDAIEYPDVFSEQAQGKIESRLSFRRWLSNLNRSIRYIPFLKPILKEVKTEVILNRYSLLEARLLTTDDVLWYLNYIQKFATTNTITTAIKELEQKYKKLHDENIVQLQDLLDKHPTIIKNHQKKVVYTLLNRNLGELHY